MFCFTGDFLHHSRHRFGFVHDQHCEGEKERRDLLSFARSDWAKIGFHCVFSLSTFGVRDCDSIDTPYSGSVGSHSSSTMSALNIPERQILLQFPDDPTFTLHYRVLFVRIGNVL